VLTGAFNKRYFDEMLHREVARAGTEEAPLSLILFDIDHFKRINDTYGHPAGDSVLHRISEVVRGVLQPEHALCRVGGEEFAILVPNYDRNQAYALGDQIRSAVEATAFSHDKVPIPVTVSVGAAQPQPAGTTTTLYEGADRMLYASKHGGRNRVSA
jgi:diguanylate cyclase (GGDEF)-like protein